MLVGCEATVKLWHDNIKVTSRRGVCRTRIAFGYFSEVVSPHIFFYNNTLSVVMRALTERLYFVKGVDGFVPCPRPVVPFKTLKYFSRSVRRSMSALPSVWTHEQFVQSYTGCKQRRYAAAASTLARRRLRRTDGYLKTFIKAELYNGYKKTDPCPRLIQPRTPEYNIELGKYLRPAEKLIYKAIDKVFGHHVVLKCDNMFTRASTIVGYWGEFQRPCFVGLDASRFDQHVSPEALEYEHEFYDSLFRSPELRELLSWQVNQVGYANMTDGSVRYVVQGCRASGDMNTALGNVFLMCGITHNFLRKLPCKWRFINDGDDCGIILESEDLPLLASLPEHHLQYGFEMEVEEPVYEIEQIEFCQCHPIKLNEHEWMMVRNIHKAMQHDWIVITTRDWCTTEDNLVATGRCGVSLYGDVPVLGAMYGSMTRAAHDERNVARLIEERDGWRRALTGHRKYPVDDTIARVSVYKAFGLLPDLQTHLEERYRAFDPRNIVTKHTLPPLSSERTRYLLD